MSSTRLFQANGVEIDQNWFGLQRVPVIGISVEQLILILYPTCLIPAALLWYLQLRKQKQSRLMPKGCKRLGLGRGQTNIADEYDDNKYSEGVNAAAEASGEPRWKIKALFIYPIKSCAPVELGEAEIDGAGMSWDRKFAFAELLTPTTRAGEPQKRSEWTFRTQRTPGFEKFALVKAEVWLPDASNGEDTQGVLLIKYPNIPYGPLAALDRWLISLGFLSNERSFQVPLEPHVDHKYPVEDVIIWKDTPKWLNFGRHVPDDFKIYMGAKNDLTLFRVDPGHERQVFRCAPRKEQLGYQPIVGFSDAYPLHLLNLASVRDVAGKVKDDIPKFSARRFRSNILLTGPPAYDEDDWKRIRIGNHEFYCACHTVRCRLPNVDPDSSERHPVEPDKALKSFRCIDDGDPKNACLGLQLVPAQNAGIQLQVCDGIEILERGEHHYLKQ